MTPALTGSEPSASSHPAFATQFPPSDVSFAGALMLDVAVGLDDYDLLREKVTDLVRTGEFPMVYPDEPVPTLEEAYARLDEVIRVHHEVVGEASDDLVAFTSTIPPLMDESGIVTSLSGFDTQEAVDDAYAAAVELQRGGRTVRGYLYVHQQDLERVVFTGRLFVGFGALSGDDADAVEVARTARAAYRAEGLPVEWDGTAGARLALSPFRWSTPYHDPLVE